MFNDQYAGIYLGDGNWRGAAQNALPLAVIAPGKLATGAPAGESEFSFRPDRIA